jgi:hypothetical protein
MNLKNTFIFIFIFALNTFSLYSLWSPSRHIYSGSEEEVEYARILRQLKEDIKKQKIDQIREFIHIYGSVPYFREKKYDIKYEAETTNNKDLISLINHWIYAETEPTGSEENNE